MEDDFEDLIRDILALYEALSTIITAALILRVIVIPSWENFGEALLFLILTLIIVYYREKTK
jgi:hypothetical protein